MGDVFDIRFLVARPTHGLTERCGEIRLGELRETFLAELSFWDEAAYRRQWAGAIAQVLAGNRSALITSLADPTNANFVRCWPMFPDGKSVIFQERILFMKDLSEPFDPHDIGRFIEPRTSDASGGEHVSEWRVSLDAVRAFATQRRADTESSVGTLLPSISTFAVVDALTRFGREHIPWISSESIEARVHDVLFGDRALAQALEDGLVTRNEAIEDLLCRYRSDFFHYLAQPLAERLWVALARELDASAFDSREPIEVTLEVVARQIAVEAQTDVVGLWAVLWSVNRALPSLTAREARAMALDVVRRTLLAEQVVVGQFEENEAPTTPFVPWDASREAVLERIEREWDGLGRDPSPGDIAWLASPHLLPFALQRLAVG